SPIDDIVNTLIKSCRRFYRFLALRPRPMNAAQRHMPPHFISFRLIYARLLKLVSILRHTIAPRSIFSHLWDFNPL
ncbi:MAG: hypothetical protein ACLTAO_11490, partial [Christensenellales bacterium]